MKLLKNKIFIAIIMCLTVLAGAFYFVAPTNRVSADDDYTLIINKVDLQTNADGVLIKDINENYIERSDDKYKPQNLLTDNIAMLLNDKPIMIDADGDTSTTTDQTYYRQYIKVSFKAPENMTLQFLEVNATLNGIAIDTKEVTTDNVGETSRSYEQFFDLTDIKLLRDQTQLDITEAQGLFEFTFGYMTKDADDITYPKNTVKASFYALDQSSYINKDTTTNIVEPRLANTENISRQQVATSLINEEKAFANIYSFFNFTNMLTKDYFDSANDTDKLYYPTITYDPTKYYVSYTKLLYGETETTTSAYDPTNKKVILTTTANGKTTTTTYAVTEEDVMVTDELDNFLYSYTNHYVEIPLYNIGNYHISFDFVVKQYNTDVYEQLVTKTFNSDGKIDKSKVSTIVSENWNRMGDIELSIYGYQLYHTVYKNVNGAGESEFTDHSGLFADVSNKNISADKIAGATINSDKNSNFRFNDELTKYDNIISTNQAPLFFKYNGSMIASGITTQSYYNLYADSSREETISSKVQIDSGTRFTQNGYYEVFIAYTYNGYKYFKDDAVENGSTMLKVQTFAFVIENIDPELTLKTVDDKNNESDFSANGYTNQNVVLTWDIKNPFNVLPEIHIYAQSFGAYALTDLTNTYQSQINEGNVTLKDSNLYLISIEYGPCTYNSKTGKFDYSAMVSYQFVIDKEKISDIEIRQVNIATFDNNDNYILGDKLTQKTTNQNFVVTYGLQIKNENEQLNNTLRNGQKPSGAKITATYSQLLLSESGTVEYLTDTEGNIYVLNGYEINSYNLNLNYSQIKKAEAKNTDILLSSEEKSAVLTENGIYLFNFEDQAGNTAQYLIILDKTSPALLKNLDAETPNYSVLKGENNIVNTDTEVVWGNYKTIKFADTISSSLSTLIDELKQINLAKTIGTTDYYFVKIDLASVTKTSTEETIDIDDTKQTFYANNPDKTFNAEEIYSFNVCDTLGNINYQPTYLEMNFDKSLLMAHIEGDAKNNVQIISKNSSYESEQVEVEGGNNYQRLFPSAITNRQKIFVDWLENVGTEYEIDSVICEFYPLTFDGESSNYPYSSTSTQTFNLTNNTTYKTINGQTRVTSNFINLVQDDRYNSSATMPGMYKIVRRYNNTLPSDSLDSTERTYYFYVDRQNIISYFNNSILVGNNIQINMQNGAKVFGGEQFLQEFINEYVLETNKLPVAIKVPTNKYNLSNVSLNLENIQTLKLNYNVQNENGLIVYDSTDSSKYTNSFIADGIYKVTVYDNATGNRTISKDGTNKLVFRFSINNSAPQVKVIKDDVVVVEDAFNTDNVKIGWNEDADGYMANINKKYLTVKALYPSGSSQVIYKLTNGVIEVGSKYGNVIKSASDTATWQYEVDLSQFEITSDCKLEITVQYEGNETDYLNNFKTTQTIYFDHTAPEYNYNKLLSSDNFLTSDEKANFYDLNSNINFENYAFMIDETFKVEYAPEDSFWKKDNDNHNINDNETAWYRRYDKYANDNDALTMQSIVPTDSRYSDFSQAPQRLRFNENLINSSNGQNYYTQIGNKNLTFYEIVNNQPGYYEIIEKDVAGNYRIYTVVICSSGNLQDTLSVKYTDKNEVTLQADWQTSSDSSYYFNINSEHITLTEIEFNLQATTVGNNWFDVILTSTKNGATTTINYRSTPTQVNDLLTNEQLLSAINDFIAYDNSLINVGYSFGITLSCSNGTTWTINYKTPGEEPHLQFAGSQTNLTVTFVQDPNASVNLTEFYVYEAQNGVPNYNEYLTNDSNDKQIEVNPGMPSAGESAQTISYTFRNTTGTGRNLVFVYKDNFGVEYKTFKIIGLTDVNYEDMIVIDGIFDKNTLLDEDGKTYYEYYTNQIAKLNYQPKIYSINSITKINGDDEQDVTDVDINNLNSIILNNGTTQLKLYSETEVNSHYIYKISLTDTLGKNYKLVVHYYSKLADLTFMDSSNKIHDLENESTVARALYLTFDKNQFTYPTDVSITRYYTNDYGEYFEETFDAQSGLMLTEGASYLITKSNKFGDSFTYNFTIRKSVATHFYSVLVKPDGINLHEISPSSVKYNYNGKNIEQYFTIYDAIVEVSSTDNLICEVEDNISYTDNATTTIYYIHTDDTSSLTYEKYIAVTKISYTKNILGNKFTINDNQVASKKLATVTTNTVKITMPAYNEASGNQVQVQIYYNSQYVGLLKDYTLNADGSVMTFELNDSGTYMLYVSDLAGNTQWFNDSTYFTLYVLNDVVYKLNGNYGINNSVYNTSVTLSFDETQTLFTRQEVSGSSYKTYIAVNATLNGKPYTPTRNADNYIFSAYGLYSVKLSGIINNDTENPIVTEVKFTIINENEAKVAHEYIGLNGYEVTKIVKNGLDITNDIREKLNMLTLNSFAISGGVNSVGGNGHYEITVKVNNSNITPTKYFTYKIWINNDTDALILCNIKEGESTTGDIQIQLNLYQIYSKIGECVIKVNGTRYITINENNASENKISTYNFSTNQRYNITLETNSGNTLSSFVVTKVEPLNTVAIIVIVVASVVVVGLTITFILLRKKMKIR